MQNANSGSVSVRRCSFWWNSKLCDPLDTKMETILFDIDCQNHMTTMQTVE